MIDNEIPDSSFKPESLYITFNASWTESGFDSTSKIKVEGLGTWEMKDLISEETKNALSKEIIEAVKRNLGVNPIK